MNEKRPITHLTNLIAEAARVYGVIPDIHPDDFVFQHSLSRNPNATVVAKRYFDRGDYAARKLSEYIARFSFGGRLGASVLDFASGYGCVARHFHRYLEKSVRVVCCDIHDEAVAFIRGNLQIEAVRSSNKPQNLEVHERFDVIFTLSFFSHLAGCHVGPVAQEAYRFTQPRWIHSFYNAWLRITEEGCLSSQCVRWLPL